MNCSPSIAIALLLLSLAAGMLLLYKTKKENLGIFFKAVSWFIIVVSVCSMLCCAMRYVIHGCMKRQKCSEMQHCQAGMREFGSRHCGMNKRVMIFSGNEGGECEEMMERKGCCKEMMQYGGGEGEEVECCKEGGAQECEKKCDVKVDVKKDSVVVKKK